MNIKEQPVVEVPEKPREYDRYQESDFQDLIKLDGVREEDLQEILKLRRVANRGEIFSNLGHTMLNNGSRDIRRVTHDFENALEDAIGKSLQYQEEDNDFEHKASEEKRLFCQIMLRILTKYPENGREICMRINSIFKRRHSEIDDVVSREFENQIEKNGHNIEILPDKRMQIVHKYPELVGEYMPVLAEMGEYDNVLELIRKRPEFSQKICPLFTDTDKGLSLETRRRLLKIYSQYPSGTDLGKTDKDFQLTLGETQTRLSGSSDPDVIRTHLINNGEQVQNLRRLIPKSPNFEVARGMQGLAMIIIDSEDPDYLLIRIIPVPSGEVVINPKTGKEDTRIDFESYHLKLSRSGIIETLYNDRYWEKGYLLKDSPTIREEDFIEAIFRNLTSKGKDTPDICDFSGFTDHVLSS